MVTQNWCLRRVSILDAPRADSAIFCGHSPYECNGKVRAWTMAVTMSSLPDRVTQLAEGWVFFGSRSPKKVLYYKR